MDHYCRIWTTAVRILSGQHLCRTDFTKKNIIDFYWVIRRYYNYIIVSYYTTTTCVYLFSHTGRNRIKRIRSTVVNTKFVNCKCIIQRPKTKYKTLLDYLYPFSKNFLLNILQSRRDPLCIIYLLMDLILYCRNK